MPPSKHRAIDSGQIVTKQSKGRAFKRMQSRYFGGVFKGWRRFRLKPVSVVGFEVNDVLKASSSAETLFKLIHFHSLFYTVEQMPLLICSFVAGLSCRLARILSSRKGCTVTTTKQGGACMKLPTQVGSGEAAGD